MKVDFNSSQTKLNLMRAFAGESQARNRYTFAQGICHQQQLYVLADLFKFTADQEKEHAEIFYNHLAQSTEAFIPVDADYPIDTSKNPQDLLNNANSHEYKEFDEVYPAFAQIARDEGFTSIAQSFENISKIEKTHGDRFGTFASLMQSGNLFSANESEVWICLNCGYILEGMQAPQTCPVCQKPQGYYIRKHMTPWGA